MKINLNENLLFIVHSVAKVAGLPAPNLNQKLPFGDEAFLLIPGDTPTLLSARYVARTDIGGVLDLAHM